MNNKENPMTIVIGGILALAIVMGIGRFAYTPILPIMQSSMNLTDTFVGYLASSNYLGYLLGALLAGLLTWEKGKLFYLRLFLIINVLVTIVMGMTEYHIGWGFFRFVSGLTSGLVFVFASSIVIDTLANHKRLSWSGIFYSGVGLGIVISGVLVPVFNETYGWHGTWIGLGVVSVILATAVFLLLKESKSFSSTKFTTKESKENTLVTKYKKKKILPWLIVSYGCEGIGYIISGTFIVAIVQQIPALNPFPTISWIFVGAAAIPSCIFWAFVAKKWGNVVTLHVLFTIQMIGVILPVFVANSFGGLIASFLFGATFMGITTLFISEARLLAPNNSSQVIGYLTFVYGIGQMIGPSIAGILIFQSGNYDSALIFASVMLFMGILFLVIYQYKSRQFLNSNDPNQLFFEKKI